MPAARDPLPLHPDAEEKIPLDVATRDLRMAFAGDELTKVP